MEQSDRHFQIAEWLGKSLHGELTPDESEKLNAWIAENEQHRLLWESLTNPAYLQERLRYWNDQDKTVYWNQLKAEIADRHSQRRIVIRNMMRYAAILLPLILALGAGWYFFSGGGKRKPAKEKGRLASIHIMPHGKVAQLKLGDGKVVNLSDSLQGYITEQDGTKLRNRASALSYVSGPGGDHTQTIYNTLLTPRGGEYQVLLSDGTKVWLNAASSLRYPTKFSGGKREVYLSGEAYFEVAKDAKHPFAVLTGKMNITVLGTKFNVNSYPGDPRQKTTLAEGLVKISNTDPAAPDKQDILLKPGYEAFLGKKDNRILINKANVEAALAWKNGIFIFDSESLGSIMQTLSRWYDIEVKYDADVDTRFHFTGRIQRYEDITGILHLIALTGKVNFTIENHELHVSLNPVKQVNR